MAIDVAYKTEDSVGSREALDPLCTFIMFNLEFKHMNDN